MGRKRGVQYKAGSFYRVDDRSGYTRRAGDTRLEWNGLIVGTNLWEPRQPQDLVKGVPDDQTVPQPRPLPPAIYDGPLYFQITENVSVGSLFIPLQYIAGISEGDAVGIMMNNGEIFNTVVNAPPTSTGVYISAQVPFPVSSGNLFVDYLVPGTEVFPDNITISLSGVQAASARGTLSIGSNSLSISLSGVSSTALMGSVSTLFSNVTVSLTGVAATASSHAVSVVITPIAERPLDIAPGAVVAYSQRALSNAEVGGAIFTLIRPSDATDDAFDSDAITGDPPITSIQTFIGNFVAVGCEIQSGGTGYDGGSPSTFNATIVGGTGTASVANVTTDGSGVVLTVNSFTQGSYTVIPSPNPRSTTGDDGVHHGTGLTVNGTFENNYLSLWADQSGSGVDGVVGSNFPNWKAASVNSLPGFLGGLVGTAGTGSVSLPNGEATIFCVVQDAATFALISSGGDTYQFGFSADPTGADGSSAFAYLTDGSNVAITNWTPPNGYQGSPAIFEIATNGTSWSYMINGVAGTVYSESDATVGSITVDTNALTWGVVGTEPIAELIVWPTMLSSGDRFLIRQNLATYYGITI